jgi:cleavage and polyadenylation specificity factor subunit 2
LKIFTSIEEFESSIPSTTRKLVLTVPSTLSYGYSREMFLKSSQNPLNLILLTSNSEQSGSLTRWLVEQVWEPAQQSEEGIRYGMGKVGKEVQMNQQIELEVSLSLLSLSLLPACRLRKADGNSIYIE